MLNQRSKYRFPLQVAALMAGLIAPLLGYVGLINHLAPPSVAAAVIILAAIFIVIWAG